MKEDLREYISLIYNDNLDLEATKLAFNIIMSGNASDIQIGSFLSILQKSGVKPHHVIGALEVMKSKMINVKGQKGSMDTCGTGGDGKNSLNISTATAFVLAARGIPIAKHGNRALTSKCGSADVLKSLGINIDMETSKLEYCLAEVGICFMFAPNHHPAMKFVGPVRQQLGIRTIFNMLGPLLNPANAEQQLVGVYSQNVFEIYKEVFTKDIKKNICLVSGYDGNDEISLDGINYIYTNNDGIVNFDPKTVDLPRSITEELKGGNAEYNAGRIMEMFNGKIDSFYHTVCINVAFGILLNEKKELNEKNILYALDETKSLIDSKMPIHVIENLSKFTKDR